MHPACTVSAPLLLARRDVSLEEQRLVLMKRRGSTVGRRSILKSFALANPPCRALNALTLEGVTDVRCAVGMLRYRYQISCERVGGWPLPLRC